MRQQKKHIEQEAFGSRGIPAFDKKRRVQEMETRLMTKLKLTYVLEMLLCLSRHKKRAPKDKKKPQNNVSPLPNIDNQLLCKTIPLNV